MSALTILSCHSSNTSKPESGSFLPVPNDFRLVIGEGGGFTGQWNGITVDSSGLVFSWRGSRAEENSRQISKLTTKRFSELWQSIADARFFDIDASGTGNMTQLMIVSANGKVHRTSWERLAGIGSEQTPAQRLYNSCRAIVGQER